MNILNLDNRILGWICHYLSDRELKSFVLSKKLKKIIDNEFARRDKLLETLLSPYTIFKKFNIEHITQAKKLLIGDIHYNPECKKYLKDLVDYWSWRGKVIFVIESTPKPEIAPLLYKTEEEKNYYLKTYFNVVSFVKNISVWGWDNKDEHESIFKNQNRIGELVDSIMKIKEKIRSELLQLIEEENKQLNSLNDKEKPLNQEQFGELPCNMPNQKILRIYDFHLEVKKLMTEIKSLNFSVKKELIEYEFEFEPAYVAQFFQDEEEMRFFREKYQKPAKELHEELREEFSIRNRSLEEVLKTLRSNSTFQIFSAGYAHFMREDFDTDDRSSVDSLHQELNSHKAMILIPTIPRNNLMKYLWPQEKPSSTHSEN